MQITKILTPVLLLCLLTGCSPFTQNTTTSGNLLTPTPVRRGKFKKKRLMNKSEEHIYWKLVGYCKNRNLNVFTQVSLGEILNANSEHYRYINAKRVDFCITDRNFMPVAVVEYQGSGHFNETYQERDAIKRQAVESAGLFYIPLHVGEEENVVNILESHFVNH